MNKFKDTVRELFEKLSALDPKQLYAVLGGVVVAFLVADYFLILGPQMGGIAGLDKKVQELKGQVTTLKGNKERLGQFQAQLEKSRKEEKSVEAMARRKDEIAGVLQMVSTMANRYGVKIDQISPQAISGAPIAQNPDGKYYRMPVFLSMRSDMRRFVAFLDRLERDQLFWQLESFVLAADERNPQLQEIRMNMVMLVVE